MGSASSYHDVETLHRSTNADTPSIWHSYTGLMIFPERVLGHVGHDLHTPRPGDLPNHRFDCLSHSFGHFLASSGHPPLERDVNFVSDI